MFCLVFIPKMFFSLHFILISVAVLHGPSDAEVCVEYRGKQQSSSTGQTCLNWINTTRDYDVKSHADSETGVGDHNYCRNPDASAQPWCYITGPEGEVQRQTCTIDDCRDQAATTVTAKVDSLPAVATDQQTRSLEPAKPAPAQKEEGPVQSIMGISQRVHTKSKKDLGTMGNVLGILMMGIIILLGVGITVGYFYKRGQDLKKKHEQRVNEREMHRIRLPLSAFSNPSCELIDENTVVIMPCERTPAQEGTEEGEEGGGPLMGQQAGTPGA